MLVAGTVRIKNTADAARRVMIDAERHALRANLTAPSRLGARQLRGQGRPAGARLAALHTETDLIAGVAAVAGLHIDRRMAGVELGPGVGRTGSEADLFIDDDAGASSGDGDTSTSSRV